MLFSSLKYRSGWCLTTNCRNFNQRPDEGKNIYKFNSSAIVTCKSEFITVDGCEITRSNLFFYPLSL